MEVTTVITYTQLRAKVAQLLGRPDIAPGTLSRWMSELGYPKGVPGRKRMWNTEDAQFISDHASYLALGYNPAESASYAKRQLQKRRASNAN